MEIILLSASPSKATKSKYCPISTQAAKINTYTGSGRTLHGTITRHRQHSSKVTSISPTYGRIKASFTNSAITISVANKHKKIRRYINLLFFKPAPPPLYITRIMAESRFLNKRIILNQEIHDCIRADYCKVNNIIGNQWT